MYSLFTFHQRWQLKNKSTAPWYLGKWCVVTQINTINDTHSCLFPFSAGTNSSKDSSAPYTLILLSSDFLKKDPELAV